MSPSDPPRETPADKPAVTAGQGGSEGARIIKRYSNRKLYDTVESRYVTLPQIALLVRKGEDVRIIDNNTKEDLTSVTLAQILYEEERKQSRALPLAALKDLIHTSGEKIISTLREGPMGKFIPSKGAEGAEAAAPPPEPTPAPPPADAREKDASSSKLYEMFEQSRVSVQEWQQQVDQRVRKVLESLSPAAQIEKLQAEVRRLTQRIEELEAKLGEKRE